MREMPCHRLALVAAALVACCATASPARTPASGHGHAGAQESRARALPAFASPPGALNLLQRRSVAAPRRGRGYLALKAVGGGGGRPDLRKILAPVLLSVVLAVAPGAIHGEGLHLQAGAARAATVRRNACGAVLPPPLPPYLPPSFFILHVL